MSETCDKLLLVQAEFDGELDAADALEAQAHRQACAECRAAYEALAKLHGLMRETRPGFTAPPSLKRALRKKFAPSLYPLRFMKLRWRDGVSFGAGAALAASLALFLVLPQQSELADAVLASHIRALQPGHLEDVISTDQHTVKPWFDGRIDFAPPVADFAAQNFPLLGGRLDYLNHRAVAALVYGRDKHLIDLYVWPESGADMAPSVSAKSGYNIVHWRQRGMEFWAISDLEAVQLRDFAQIWIKPG
jgi:anti-sigma factor RsiW